ncbi:hypothetical protein Tco_1204900 [Tanacetum coccineum]
MEGCHLCRIYSTNRKSIQSIQSVEPRIVEGTACTFRKQSNGNAGTKAFDDAGNESEASGKDSEVPSTEEPRKDQRVNQELDASINITNNINTASNGNNTNNVNAVSSTVNAARIEVNVVDP